MSDIATNRDLYLAVARLVGRHSAGARSLEEYLRALWGAARRYRERAALTPDEFFGVLGEAFTADPESFGDEFRGAASADTHALDLADVPGYQGWEHRVVRQILDLREMAEGGQLADEMRYYGIRAPRGSRWYNFDPCTFLECAMAGAFGGWEPGDDTGRRYVPGQVAVLGPDGLLTSCDPQDVDNPVAALAPISWESFRDFLGEGQWYE